MTVESVLETAGHRVAAKLVAQQGRDVKAISPEMLTLILEAALMAIGRCLEGSRLKEVAGRLQNPGLLGELAVRRSVRILMRETYGPFGFYRHDGAELVRAVLETGREASTAERHELVRHIHRQLA